MLESLPVLAHHFGVRPWEVERLTPLELREFHLFIKRQNESVDRNGD